MTTILFLNKVPPYSGGGAEAVIWKTGKYLANSGWDVHYMCPLSIAESPPNVDNVSFHDVPTPSGYLSGRATFFLTGIKKYSDLLSSVEPDIVYDNMSPFPFIPAHIGPQKHKVVTKIHGIEGVSAIFNKPHLLTKIGTIIGYEFLRLKSGRRIISVSESCAEHIRERVQNPDEVTVIPNGINVSDFEPAFSPDGPILALCLMTPKKGVQTLLRAWEQIEDIGIDRELLIAGSGPSLEEYKSLSDDLGLTNVSFLGFVSEKKKIELFRDAFAYILPTRGEGLVLTNLEAMASKCVVISTNVDGVRDYLDDHENGLVVEPRSPHQLAGAIQEAVRNPREQKRLAQNGYDTVVEQYSLDNTLAMEHEYLESLL